MIQGQVVHKRTPGKNLVFLDIIEDVEGERRRTSVLFKDQSLLEQVKRGDKKVHLGDSLSVEGSFDGSIFLARNFTLIEAWKDKFPGKTFQAIPPNCSSKQSQKTPCKSWLNSGSCPLGDECIYEHIKDQKVLKLERHKHVKAKLSRRLAAAHQHEDDPESLVSRHQRARLFAEWIASTYDLTQLQSGYLLDVAGGRGDLAFELALNHNLKCIVVDPRDDVKSDMRKRRKYQRSKLKKLKKENETLFDHIKAEFNEAFFESHPEYKDKISLVLGLHPDQATEPLVDVCLKNDLKFAVIPCCVFAHDNPGRRLKNGSNPNTYETFCDYLVEKSDCILTSFLSFRGRNKVLYRD